MIEKPTHGEPPRQLAGEKSRAFRPGRPLKLIIVAAVVLIALLVVISGWIQKWLWMRQLGYSGVFWTLLSVRWELFSAAFVVALLYLWINLRFAARNGATFSAGKLTSESTVALKLGIPISPTVLKLAMGAVAAVAALGFAAHLLWAMGYLSPLSLWRIVRVDRSSLRASMPGFIVSSALL